MNSIEEEIQRGTTAAPLEDDDVSNVKPKASANGKRAPANSAQKKRKKEEISKQQPNLSDDLDEEDSKLAAKRMKLNTSVTSDVSYGKKGLSSSFMINKKNLPVVPQIAKKPQPEKVPKGEQLFSDTQLMEDRYR